MAVTAAVAASDRRLAQAAQGEEFDLSRFAPPESQAVIRGRVAADRFGLGRRFELSLQVNNAFAAQNRRAIGRAETAIAALPGVRRVIGPAGLLEITVDESGRALAAPALGGGPGDEASEAVRQRLMRRSDAIGWFVSRDGTELRLLVDTDDLESHRAAIEAAAASSGLVLLSGGIPAYPLWPEPDRDPRPFPAWLPFALMALALLPAGVAVAWVARPATARALLVLAASGLAASAVALPAPARGLRHLGLWGGLAAAGLMAALMSAGKLARRTDRDAVPVSHQRLSVPLTILTASVVLIAAAVVLVPRISLGTQLWRQTSVFFVEVSGDMEEPIVLREIRRLTDALRAQPGVAHAWSVADLFFAVPLPGETFGGIPSSRRAVRAILARARDDSAVRLELAPDHRGALVGVRLDEETGLDRLRVLDELEQYLQREHRPALVRVDMADPRVSPASRELARGILAADTQQRMLRICERSGRILGDSDVQTIELAARRAALVPIVDPTRLKAEISQAVRAFLAQPALVAAEGTGPFTSVEAAAASGHGAAVRAGAVADRQRLIDELGAQPFDASLVDVMGPVALFWGRRRLPETMLPLAAADLHRRLAAVRRLHSARISFNDVLYGADLPTEGVLSEEVRDATLDAMGPIAAVPVAPDAPGALLVDAAAVGGAACDRALSIAWLPRLALGVGGLAVIIGFLLLALSGTAGLVWWPIGFGPAAPLVVVPGLAGVPIGSLYLAVLAGALAGGVGLAVAFSPAKTNTKTNTKTSAKSKAWAGGRARPTG